MAVESHLMNPELDFAAVAALRYIETLDQKKRDRRTRSGSVARETQQGLLLGRDTVVGIRHLLGSGAPQDSRGSGLHL